MRIYIISKSKLTILPNWDKLETGLGLVGTAQVDHIHPYPMDLESHQAHKIFITKHFRNLAFHHDSKTYSIFFLVFVQRIPLSPLLVQPLCLSPFKGFPHLLRVPLS